MSNIFLILALIITGLFTVMAASLFICQWIIYSRVEATMTKPLEEKNND